MKNRHKKNTAFFHSEHCLWHASAGLYSLISPVGGWLQPPASAGLAESPESKRRIVSLLSVSDLKNEVEIIDAPAASEEDLLRIHPAHYLQEFKKLSDDKGGELGPYAPFGSGSYEIAKLSAGLALAALDSVVTGKFKNAYALSRPPGHHCLPDTPMGFCLLANIPIAIEAILNKHHHIKKIAVIDWDVHHGNGTQHIYYERDDVLTISLHQEGCFPPGYVGIEDIGSGRGEGYNFNIPLLPGGGHDSYMYAMEKIVCPAIKKFCPDVIIVASGLDANAVDPLARMLAHSDTFREMTKIVMSLAHQVCEDRIILVHEGGYAESSVPFCAHAIIETLTGTKSNVIDPMLDLFKKQQPNNQFIQFQRKIIDDMAAYFAQI